MVLKGGIKMNVRKLLTLLTLSLLALATQAQGQAVHRSIEEFVNAQGTYCIDDGSGGCLLFVPPDPNFLGWDNDKNDSEPGIIYFAGIDYAGLANAYPSGKKPVIDGTVTERPLDDDRAEVTVLLHTKNANAWVIELDQSGDVSAQIANKPTLFGHRPADVLAGKGQALADTFLHVRFINTAPGAPLPDLIQLQFFPEEGQELQFLAFNAHSQGPLTAEFGVLEGTLGKCTVTQTGLLVTNGQGQALEDGFPVEDISLQVIGKGRN
jgi:hypothetical protein